MSAANRDLVAVFRPPEQESSFAWAQHLAGIENAPDQDDHKAAIHIIRRCREAGIAVSQEMAEVEARCRIYARGMN